MELKWAGPHKCNPSDYHCRGACTMYITSNSFVTIESYVPSVSKVGARGLVLSLQYMSRVKEEGEVRLHEGKRCNTT